MNRSIAVILYVLLMIGLIVGVDIAFFRDRLWERFIANIGIVLVFVAIYFRFVKDIKSNESLTTVALIWVISVTTSSG